MTAEIGKKITELILLRLVTVYTAYFSTIAEQLQEPWRCFIIGKATKNRTPQQHYRELSELEGYCIFKKLYTRQTHGIKVRNNSFRHKFTRQKK